MAQKINTAWIHLVSKVPWPLDVVDSFTYLGAKITSQHDSSTDINARIGKASGVFARLRKPLWSQGRISLRTKMRVFNVCVMSTALYSCETWTILSNDMKQLEVFQMRCLRSILGVSLLDRITNVQIRARCCGQPTVEAQIKKSRLRWFGHVCRMSPQRLPHRALFATKPLNWKIPRRAPRKKWVDHITSDLRPLHFNSLEACVEAAMNRNQWRGIIRDVLPLAPTSKYALPYLR